MSEWIKVEDRLPEEYQHCWIYGVINHEKLVLDGIFTSNATDYNGETLPLKTGKGWEYNEDRGDYIMLEDVTHWMPYFVPEPPNEE